MKYNMFQIDENFRSVVKVQDAFADLRRTRDSGSAAFSAGLFSEPSLQKKFLLMSVVQ
jgi:hypothetical protein